MSDEPELHESEVSPERDIAWGKLASAWGAGLVVRVILVFTTYVFLLMCFGYDWPNWWKYIVFVPGAVAGVLVAGAIYPQRCLLAMSAALLIPPDYGAPVGLALAGLMRLARTKTSQGFVVIGALIVMWGLSTWLIMSSVSTSEPVGVQSEVTRFIRNEVVAPSVEVKWDGTHQARLAGLPRGWSGTVTVGGSKYGARRRGSNNNYWPGPDDFNVKEISITLVGPRHGAAVQPGDLVNSGMLRPDFARRFGTLSDLVSPVVTCEDYTVTGLSSPGAALFMFRRKP